MKYRDLDKLSKMVKDATGLDIVYAFDDLAFPEHSAFIIQYSENDKDFFCFFHKDCIPSEKEKIHKNLVDSFEKNNCTLELKSSFELKQKGEEVEIHLM